MRAVKSAIPGAIPGMVKLKKTQTSGREPISLSGIWSTAYNAVYYGRLLRRQRPRERSSGGSGSAAKFPAEEPGLWLDYPRPRARRRQGARYHQLWSTWVHDHDRALRVFGTIREIALNSMFEMEDLSHQVVVAPWRW